MAPEFIGKLGRSLRFRVSLLRPSLLFVLILFLTLFALLYICSFFLSQIAAGLGALAKFQIENPMRAVATIASLGFLTMALIQALRSVLPLRGWFTLEVKQT